MVDILNTNNRYTIYINKCIELAETIVIKLDDVAYLMNYLVVSKLGVNSVDLTDKSTWKYYQNIAGIYHNSDKMMRISSLDIDGEIDFTVANLATNKNTREAYKFGSRYYTELVSLYPDQELLILGILYPVDINVAINAKNGQILNYPSELVEDNEYSLIRDLQTIIDNYLFRWVNSQYKLSDDLYVATYVGMLSIHVLQAIISLRLSKCNTNEAHSYHLRQYLASHAFLDNYLDALNKKQSLSFYRNIRYIERNVGKNDTLDMVIDKTMTIRNLPIYQLQVKHDVSRLNVYTGLAMEDNESLFLELNRQITPDPIIRREGINSPTDGIKLNDYTLEKTLSKLEELTPNNAEYQNDNLDTITNKLVYSDSSVLSTKLLESNVIDRTDSLMYPLSNILYNHWIYLTAKGKYKSFIFIELPIENLSLRLSPQQALGLYLYCTMRLYNNKVSKTVSHQYKIPKIRVDRVIRIPVPNINELVSIVDTNKLPLSEIQRIYNTRTELDDFVSVQDFRTLCENIFEKAQEQYIIYSSQEDKDARGYAQNLVARLYTDETVFLDELVNINNDPMSYQEFLDSLNINLDNYDTTRLSELAATILSVAVLENNNPTSKLQYIQNSMISLLLKLSSYSIEVINDINTLPIVIAPVQIIRINTNKIVENVSDYVYDSSVDFSESSVVQKQKYLLSTKDLLDFGDVRLTNKIKEDLTDMITVRVNRVDKDIVNYRNYNVGLDHQGRFTSSGEFQNIPEDDRVYLFDKLRAIQDIRIVRDPLNLDFWLYNDFIVP